MEYREPLEELPIWMRYLEPGESDKNSCLWCKEMCTLQGDNSLYICALQKLYFAREGQSRLRFDQVSCPNHEEVFGETFPVFDGEEPGLADSLKKELKFMVMFS